MKKTLCIALVLTALLSMVAGCSGSGSKKEVNVYNWGEYIDESIFTEFEAQTGIKVNYKTYESNEQMYAVLAGGGVSYDVIIPSDYMIARLIAEDMLQPLDFSNIPNYANIDPSYRGSAFDPEDTYSVPYAWGTVGIIYNGAQITDEITSWSSLFDEKYAGQILMFDNPRDALGIALKYLGYSVNTTDKSQLREAADLLVAQNDVLQARVMDQIFDKLEGGEALIGPYYAGDYITMVENNPDLKFCFPQEGTNIFIDSMCIPTCAQNKANAEAFINFMCSDEITLANMDVTGYCTPSATAYEQLPDEVKNDPVLYPDADVLARCEAYSYLPEDINAYYDELWLEIKS